MTKATDIDSSLTIDRLCEVLNYEPITGNFYWLISDKGKKQKGQLAGELKPSGYILIGIDNRRYRAHRLAWFFMTGEWPLQQVDHKNNCRADNRWENLRLATNQQNQMNSTISRNNTSGYKGVYWNKQRNKWAAKLNKNGKQIHGGFFDDPAKAAEAYIKLAQQYFPEFARSI